MKKYRQNSAVPIAVVMLLIAAALLTAAGILGYSMYRDKSYPLDYSEYVEKYSAENGLNKFLVYAVIKTESGFRSDAVSNVGARGLMQITEDTFDWIKYRLGDEETVYYDMYDPETNIKYGCWFLGFLSEEFAGVDEVASAYHAGRGSVNEWLKNKKYSSDGIHLKEIPIKDTAHYVYKITKAMDAYIRLYDK